MLNPVARLSATLAYPHFGIGHGFNDTNVFRPARSIDEWVLREKKYRGEIARHTIVDRLGAIALLPGRLTGVRVDISFSNHLNDIIYLREKVMPQLRTFVR